MFVKVKSKLKMQAKATLTLLKLKNSNNSSKIIKRGQLKINRCILLLFQKKKMDFEEAKKKHIIYIQIVLITIPSTTLNKIFQLKMALLTEVQWVRILAK